MIMAPHFQYISRTPVIVNWAHSHCTFYASVFPSQWVVMSFMGLLLLAYVSSYPLPDEKRFSSGVGTATCKLFYYSRTDLYAAALGTEESDHKGEVGV